MAYSYFTWLMPQSWIYYQVSTLPPRSLWTSKYLQFVPCALFCFSMSDDFSFEPRKKDSREICQIRADRHRRSIRLILMERSRIIIRKLRGLVGLLHVFAKNLAVTTGGGREKETEVTRPEGARARARERTEIVIWLCGQGSRRPRNKNVFILVESDHWFWCRIEPLPSNSPNICLSPWTSLVFNFRICKGLRNYQERVKENQRQRRATLFGRLLVLSTKYAWVWLHVLGYCRLNRLTSKEKKARQGFPAFSGNRSRMSF